MPEFIKHSQVDENTILVVNELRILSPIDSKQLRSNLHITIPNQSLIRAVTLAKNNFFSFVQKEESQLNNTT